MITVDIPTSHGSFEECCVCGRQTESKHIGMKGILFMTLEDNPFICDRCIYTTITKDNHRWYKQDYLDILERIEG